MRLKKGNQVFLLLFLMGICMLTGCKSMSPVEENTDIEVQIEAVYEEKTESPTEEETTDESEYFSTPEEIAELGLPEDMLAYWMVLNSKQPFISTDEGNQEFYWNEYYWCLGNPVGRHQADYFMIIDMNGDGANEIVLYCSPESTQVLHYEDGAVYSYQFVFRGMKRIHTNGIYEGSDGAASTSYYCLTELNKDGYTKEMLAKMDDDYYEVEGVEVTQEEFSNYVESIEAIELAMEFEFTEDMLDTCLLGNLSAEELSVVKHASIREMGEIDMNDLIEKEEIQAYRAVLLSEESFISVTDDNGEYYLNNYHLWKGEYSEDFQIRYYSTVDMNQDGIYELVLTAWGTTQIMHYEAGKVYSYQFDYDEIGTIANDGVFMRMSPYDYGYRKIVSFEKDGCVIEVVDNHEDINDDRIRYYFFTPETEYSEYKLLDVIVYDNE